MRISSLRSFLQSLCCNSPWNYAAFWKLKYQPEMVLTWEDSFCDIAKQRDAFVPIEDFYFDSLDDVLCSNFNSRHLDGSLVECPIGLAVAEMSSASHVFGKGVVGVAAFTGVPRWVYSNNIAADVFDSVFADEYPDEWLLQFVAGIETILLLPVIPHGVLQLGSLETVAEDALLVSLIRQHFDSYRKCDRYDTICPLPKFSLMPTDLENLEDPSIVTTNNRKEDQKTIPSNGSEVRDIFVPDQMVPTIMVQDLCNPFIAGLVNSYGNLIDIERGLQSLDNLTCEEDKSEISRSVLVKPSRLNEKARHFSLSDNFTWMKHGEFENNELGHFYFEEGSIDPIPTSNDFVYDCETGGTLLTIPGEYELQKAYGPAVVGHFDHLYDPPISGPNALWSSINDRDHIYCMDLSGVESAAFTQKDDETDHLIETIVADAYSNTDDSSSKQPNPATPLKTFPGNVFACSPKICSKLKRNASGEGDTDPFRYYTSAFVDTGSTVSSLSPLPSSSESTMTALIDKQQQRRKGNHFVNQRKVSKLSSTHKRNLCSTNNQKPRPRDRQLIQDRIKELRDLVPNSDKCSIDGLLDKTIKHMLFLRDVTNQADKLRRQVLKEETNNTAITAEELTWSTARHTPREGNVNHRWEGRQRWADAVLGQGPTAERFKVGRAQVNERKTNRSNAEELIHRYSGKATNPFEALASLRQGDRPEKDRMGEAQIQEGTKGKNDLPPLHLGRNEDVSSPANKSTQAQQSTGQTLVNTSGSGRIGGSLAPSPLDELLRLLDRIEELLSKVVQLGTLFIQPPLPLDELLRLLDRIEELLSKVEQSPAKSMLTALSPLMDALIAEDFLKHSDVDVKVGVASCISEITRITAPDAPYDDDKMKEVFHLIVSSFEDWSDTSSRSHHKKASIFETVAKVRSCVIMLEQVANATNAGDGTTCATVLTQTIIAEGCKSIAAGMNAMDLRRGISRAVDVVITSLKSRARMIRTSEEITQVGTIATGSFQRLDIFWPLMKLLRPLGVETNI
ncbi:transcription factor LHW [Dorcoceras hygrometricum]|uniref:Transcription factor LHW n=1 Tax=Dorcoceras hygrometricum TaxID=472368 RepID=A0A2Z7D204_9LAMI|nr:transcription factor LHW [Dorcoceras hygrometricum]